MKIEAIFFDMGGTLDLYPASEQRTKEACLKMQSRLVAAGAPQIGGYSENQFRNMVFNGIKKYQNWRKTENIELSPEKFFSDFVLADTGVAPRIINALGEELAFLIDVGFHERTPRPEAAAVLQAIKERRIRLGIISNVVSRTQVGYSLAQYGIKEYFDPIVLSSVFGKRKPHPAIFHYAFRTAGVNPANVIFVGNSPTKDIMGARNAGVGKTVCIEYSETPAAEMGPAADYHIQDLRELLAITDGLDNSLR
jgi:putative hydrolase of the HAD superfamily